ncbi:dihydrodipicolinate synthase family protein [Bosea sp. 117]|uniref:dihydrodipicolinate synthase family protein n=1 Tax=Bosea sp. 117 TaxID=1125973 RepID=UPI0009DECF04|nr:dihydrodipicolinate synthase family protein [Bosea sp. 117]
MPASPNVLNGRLVSDELPTADCLMVAAATPVTPEFTPDIDLLAAHCAWLFAQGCDGITLFGTTGEGAEFAVEDRCRGLEGILAAGVPAGRLMVSANALAIPDIVRLARHALDHGVRDILLMPPCVYRGGITEEGTFRFYAGVIERIARAELRLCLYHFPDICGVPLTPRLIRRLDEDFPGIVAGVKDSGGDLDYTEALVRRFAHLSIFVGSEIHLPQALAFGARGTICGLGNVMPRLMRAMCDAPTAFDRRALVPIINSGDLILSRQPFVASVKAVLAEGLGLPSWRRTVPPMADVAMPERGWMLRDFMRWEAGLPADWRSFHFGAVEGATNVVHMRRA